MVRLSPAKQVALGCSFVFSRSSYTGYIDIEARHIFFYFFESRNDPAKDDVIFWTNGGTHSGSQRLLRLQRLGAHSFNGRSWLLKLHGIVYGARWVYFSRDRH